MNGDTAKEAMKRGKQERGIVRLVMVPLLVVPVILAVGCIGVVVDIAGWEWAAVRCERWITDLRRESGI